MWNKFISSKFFESWSLTLAILFSPGFVISAGVTCLALYLSVFYKTNIPFSNTMAIVGSVFGGVAGAFLKDEYDKMSGKNILEKKGRSALRNLQGIRTQLRNIELWVADFSKHARKKEDKRTLEEINRHIATTDLNISAGLEDWVDIVPELKEKSEKAAEIEKKYKEVAQSVMVEILEKRKELASAKDEKIETELKKKIGDLEKQIKEIKRDRSQATHGLVWNSNGVLNEPFNATSVNLNEGISTYSLGTQKCEKCGRLMSPYSATVRLNQNRCDDCQDSFLGRGSALGI